MRSRCPQRKRSSSLPVPKIEVSLCSESKSKEAPSRSESYRQEDYSDSSSRISGPHSILVLANHSPLFVYPYWLFYFWKKKMESIFEWFIGSSPSPAVKEEVVGTNTSGTKRRKMADLRAFVETRLLSRSDKMLEKIDLKNTANNNRCLLAAPDTVRAFIICKWNDLIFRNVFCFSLPFLFHLFTKSSFKNRCWCLIFCRRKSIRPRPAWMLKLRYLLGRCRRSLIPGMMPHDLICWCRNHPLWSKAKACPV